MSDHASADVNVELQTDVSEGNNRYKSVSIEDTYKCILENRNKSDIKMFFDWCQSNGELRVPEDIPFNELDGLLARFYLGMLDHLNFLCVFVRGGRGGVLFKKVILAVISTETCALVHILRGQKVKSCPGTKSNPPPISTMPSSLLKQSTVFY